MPKKKTKQKKKIKTQEIKYFLNLINNFKRPEQYTKVERFFKNY